MLILFVEYHAAFRQSASYMMDQEADMEVVSQAGSVAEGREKMAKGGIDAAIVDVPLPDEGAAEMVGELHDANPSVPVLVLTRAEDPEAVEAFLNAGASEVLSKQCTFAQILAAVRRLGDEAWGQRAPDERREAPMRRPLSPDQRRRVEELLREKEERCGLCSSTGLRCDEDAATFVGGGFNVRVLCTNTGAEAHAGGFGLARDYSVTPDEARRVGLG